MRDLFEHRRTTGWPVRTWSAEDGALGSALGREMMGVLCAPCPMPEAMISLRDDAGRWSMTVLPAVASRLATGLMLFASLYATDQEAEALQQAMAAVAGGGAAPDTVWNDGYGEENQRILALLARQHPDAHDIDFRGGIVTAEISLDTGKVANGLNGHETLGQVKLTFDALHGGAKNPRVRGVVRMHVHKAHPKPHPPVISLEMTPGFAACLAMDVCDCLLGVAPGPQTSALAVEMCEVARTRTASGVAMKLRSQLPVAVASPA